MAHIMEVVGNKLYISIALVAIAGTLLFLVAQAFKSNSRVASSILGLSMIAYYFYTAFSVDTSLLSPAELLESRSITVAVNKVYLFFLIVNVGAVGCWLYAFGKVLKAAIPAFHRRIQIAAALLLLAAVIMIAYVYGIVPTAICLPIGAFTYHGITQRYLMDMEEW